MTRALWFLVWCLVRAYAATRPRCSINRGQMTRYFLTGDKREIRAALARGETGMPGLYLHRVNTADSDARGLHNHPWSRGDTRVLRGEYIERRQYDDGARLTFIRRAGNRATLPPEVFHRITSVKPNTWTLFRASEKHGRGWGFRDAGRRNGSGPLDVPSEDVTLVSNVVSLRGSKHRRQS